MKNRIHDPQTACPAGLWFASVLSIIILTITILLLLDKCAEAPERVSLYPWLTGERGATLVAQGDMRRADAGVGKIWRGLPGAVLFEKSPWRGARLFGTPRQGVWSRRGPH